VKHGAEYELGLWSKQFEEDVWKISYRRGVTRWLRWELRALRTERGGALGKEGKKGDREEEVERAEAVG
jgi:hypothetical protein